MNPVNWFEIPAKDLERAKKFYDTVFGLDTQYMEMPDSKMYMFAGDPTNPGSLGALYQSEGMEPASQGTTVYFSVEDVEPTLNKVEGAGGSIVFPKMSIGEFGFIGQIIDSEGNKIGVHSTK